MGTSTENNHSREDEEEEEADVIIPWSCVPYMVRVELIKKLNPDVALSGNDWRMLAGELGFTPGDIHYIESDKDNNTNLLFKNYDQRPGASLNEVHRCLEKMNRLDCVQILDNALPEIHRFHQDQMLQMVENVDGPPLSGAHYQWSNNTCPCSFPPHRSSMYGGHSYCPCSHSVTRCPSHHPSPSSFQIPLALPSHPHHPMCHNQLPSGSPGYHGGSPVHNRNLPCAHAFPVTSSHPRSQTGMAETAPYRGSPTYNRNHAEALDSMLIESDPHIFTQRQVPSLQSNSNNSSMGGNDGRMLMEEEVGAALPQTPFRGNGLMPNSNIPLPINIKAMDNNNLASISSTKSGSLNYRPKMSRQNSDECNTSKNLNGDKRFCRNNIQGKEGSDQYGYGHPEVMGQNESTKPLHVNSSPKYYRSSSNYSVQEGIEDMEMKLRNEVYSNGQWGQSRFPEQHYQTATVRENRNEAAGVSLAYLEKLAEVPDKYKPTNEYKTVVAEQKIEEERGRKSGKDSLDSNVSHSSSSSSGSSKSRPPSTFPMRVKPKPERRMEDLASLSITKKKSTSMPQNMKLDSFRRGFRHVKVFVTYSYDNDEHGRKVLSLCKFLQTNNFACCVDVTEKKDSAKSQDLLDWCRKRVNEADFILVCISPKYLEDIASNRTFPQQAGERQMHTREIYGLMHDKYISSQHCDAPSRFIPLLFGNMTKHHIPDCMGKSPAYIWPEQYMDLAWMLTKPQERIQASQRERRDGHTRPGASLEGAVGTDSSSFNMDGVSCSS